MADQLLKDLESLKAKADKLGNSTLSAMLDSAMHELKRSGGGAQTNDGPGNSPPTPPPPPPPPAGSDDGTG